MTGRPSRRPTRTAASARGAPSCRWPSGTRSWSMGCGSSARHRSLRRASCGSTRRCPSAGVRRSCSCARTVQRTGVEACGGLAGLVRQRLRVAQAGTVVDRDVREFPAAPARCANPIAVDAVADTVDVRSSLGVDAQQLAGRLALVADDLRPGLKRREPTGLVAAQDGPDRRAR